MKTTPFWISNLKIADKVVSPSNSKELDKEPVQFDLQLANGAMLQMVVPEKHISLAQGPFTT